MPSKTILTNQFGEKSINIVGAGSTGEPQAVVDNTPAKTGVQAIAALALDADLPTTVLKVNAILAALKAVV